MANGNIAAVYVGLIRPPRRFVVHRVLRADLEVFEVYKPRTLRAFVSQLLRVLSSTGPDFMSRVASLDDKHFQGNKLTMRRYVAEDRDVLYINSAHLTDKNSEKVLGYWVATNVGRKEVGTIVDLACQAAGVPRESISRLQRRRPTRRSTGPLSAALRARLRGRLASTLGVTTAPGVESTRIGGTYGEPQYRE